MKILSILLIVFAAQISVLAQNEKEITAVRTEVNAINKSSAKLKKETKDIFGLSAEGAEAVYFLSGTEFKKITATFYGETFKATVEIFYRENAPIFIFKKSYRYDIPINTGRRQKIVSTEEQRIYFSDGNTVKVMIGKNEIKASDERFAEVEKSLTETSQDLIKAYSQKEEN